MRVYRFLSKKHALSSLKNQQLKITTIDDLNDPFELWLMELPNRQMRNQYRSWRKEMSQSCGLLSFSKTWKNPLLWSHYADRHKGICLGFDVRDDLGESVEYVKSRVPLDLPPTSDLVKRTLFSKYEGWSYEEEWRAWIRLTKRGSNSPLHHFQSFDESLRLKEIIIGPLCSATKIGPTLQKTISHYSPQPEISKARLAFGSFRIVKDLQYKPR